MPERSGKPGSTSLDRVVAKAQRDRLLREQGYRERALRIYPWICGRCAREFTRENLRELTVHHRDHNHENNPVDGSNWELLCVYCHDNEHARWVNPSAPEAGNRDAPSSYQPFGDLGELLKHKP
jgi:5-methylcytosine-specific restriction endonuclease McrA